MNPFQHGEVYVLNDGAETDLDLGHYERFTNCVLSRHNNLTSGQVMSRSSSKSGVAIISEKTVQVIPHVTDVIKDRIRELSDESKYDVVITEIGGTTGDIEGLPFLEAIRQLILEVGLQNVVNMHVTLVPYIRAAHELKTKPNPAKCRKIARDRSTTQVLICRTERPLDRDVRQKLSMFLQCFGKEGRKAVIEALDVEHTVYEYPLMLHTEGLDQLVCDLLNLRTPGPDLADWRKFVERVVSPKRRVKIAVVGKYIDLQDAYKSIYESLTHAAASEDCGIDLQARRCRVAARRRQRPTKRRCRHFDSRRFGERGVEGKSKPRSSLGRTMSRIFGLCLGMQVATIEFARNVCDIKGANSTEFDKKAKEPVISLLEEQAWRAQQRWEHAARHVADENCARHTRREIYGRDEVMERHRHRLRIQYEIP